MAIKKTTAKITCAAIKRQLRDHSVKVHDLSVKLLDEVGKPQIDKKLYAKLMRHIERTTKLLARVEKHSL